MKGKLYPPDDRKQKHRELEHAFEEQFKVKFRDNGNSFDSCFQFEGHPPDGQLQLRVKYYCKTLSLLQSESVTKSLSMNFISLFYPTIRMGRALRESRNEG